MKFFYVYILLNEKTKWMYVGFTKKLRIRYQTHQQGKVVSTKNYLPLKLIFYEAYKNKNDALRRERYFKTTKGKTSLKYMLKEYLNER